jgi:hypothetical protein
MKKIKILLGILSITILLTICGCGNKAINKLKEVTKITGNKFIGYCEVGSAGGEATIIVNGSVVTVKYTAMGYYAKETGYLENFKIKKDDKGYFKIYADWNNRDAGDGYFNFKVLHDEDKIVYCGIKGPSWDYWGRVELNEEDYNKVLKILLANK